jgi:hypothetical protein
VPISSESQLKGLNLAMVIPPVALASSELAEDVVDRARELVEVPSALRSSSWAVFSKAVKEPSVNPASSQNSEQGQVLDARSCLSTRAVVTSHCGIP